VSRRDAEGAEGKNAQEPAEDQNRLTEAVIGRPLRSIASSGRGFFRSSRT
jgi:hypothetical protein